MPHLPLPTPLLALPAATPNPLVGPGPAWGWVPGAVPAAVVAGVRTWAVALGCASLLSATALPVAAAAVVAAPAATPTPAAVASASTDTRLRCEVVYQPTQHTWVREVVLTHSGKRLATVAIDGVAVYTFALSGPVVLTSLDNERIQLDLSQPAWTSDFRGLASGRGLCMLLP